MTALSTADTASDAPFLWSRAIIHFHASLKAPARLPADIRAMNPYEAPTTRQMSEDFYHAFYADSAPRHLILGINPGRHGAGLTGIPFTDTARLEGECGLSAYGVETYELSAEFVYKVIARMGGAAAFFGRFFISSPSPLGYVVAKPRGKQTTEPNAKPHAKPLWVNINYYDRKDLQEAVRPFMVASMKQLCAMPIARDTVWCLGQGKNAAYLNKLNAEYGWFKRIIALPHPRYIMQYQRKRLNDHIEAYAESLNAANFGKVGLSTTGLGTA